MPAHDRNITGAYHYLNLPSGHVLFVSEPIHYALAEKHLQDLGGTVFPEIEAHEQIPPEISGHVAFKDAGLNANDTSYQALKKLAAKFGWPQIDPRR
jgi:hypothetical protein